MCGINGFTFKNPELIEKMNRTTAHRGPDQDGFWVGDHISLGHNRLSIIDLSPRGKQPMWDNAKEIVVIFNGEIYNFQELREELSKKYTFQSTSDTEVIIYAYREYGIECVKKFNGIFAFALWDTRSEELFLVRDHAGIKPLYYYVDSGKLIFSSEIKGILAHDIPRAVNRQAFNLYFQILYIPEPHTMFEGVYKLPPASYLHFRHNRHEIVQYWKTHDFSEYTDYHDTKKKIRTIFEDSVKRQLISDRPVGVFLSGGIDSTAVLGAVSKNTREKVRTYSVGFIDSTDEEKFNADFYLARKTAEKYGTDHHELRISAKDIAQNLEAIAWHLDEPNFNATAGAIFLLAQEAKKSVAVVLGGDGGDELFGGYPRYFYSRLISKYQKLPKSIQKLGAAVVRRENSASKLSLAQDESRVLAFLAQKDATLKSIVHPQVYDPETSVTYLHHKYFTTPYAGDFEKYCMYIDQEGWLVDESLVRTDKMTMAHGLEERVPILDYRMIELSLKIPTQWKFSLLQRPRNFQGKNIWRDALHDMIPAHIMHEKKRGWFTPMAKWIRGDLKPIVENIMHESSSEYFNRSGLDTLWKEHLEGRGYHLNSIWAVVMWELWYHTYIKKS